MANILDALKKAKPVRKRGLPEQLVTRDDVLKHMTVHKIREYKRDDWQPENFQVAMIKQRLDKMYAEWNDAKGDRIGIHASSVVATPLDFCYRQQVLSQFFPKAVIQLHGKVLRIFLHGWVIHQKWQKLFSDTGLAKEVETTHYSKEYGVSFTPDAIIVWQDEDYIVEIKTMNHTAYCEAKHMHVAAQRQAQLYMYLTGVRKTIVLVEDKDTQDFKIWILEYDESMVQPFIRRLTNLGQMIGIFKKDRRLPKRHKKCSMPDTSKAKQCPVRDACFATKEQRERMLKKAKADREAAKTQPKETVWRQL